MRLCGAKPAHSCMLDVVAFIDIGGQDSKANRVEKSGPLVDFVMNCKCAVRTGGFIEVMAIFFEVSLGDIGKFSFTSQRPCLISSTCTVFAE
jgi:activator of 2-hydroxyglutaryl-CoA dehydratase